MLDNIDFLKNMILYYADRQYGEEVVDCSMEKELIGPGKDFSSKEDWMESYIQCWIESTIQDFYNDIQKKKSLIEMYLKADANPMRSKILNLQLAESMQFDDATTISRVLAGWQVFFKGGSDVEFIPHHRVADQEQIFPLGI